MPKIRFYVCGLYLDSRRVPIICYIFLWLLKMFLAIEEIFVIGHRFSTFAGHRFETIK